MTRKTKRKKIAADLKKEKYSFFQAQDNSQSPLIQKTSSPVKKDLVKSVFLALFVLGLELVLYWQLS